MARTKKRAKRTTGGKAPRKVIGEKPGPIEADTGARWDAQAASEADPVSAISLSRRYVLTRKVVVCPLLQWRDSSRVRVQSLAVP